MTCLINALRFSATLALAGCSASACEPPLGDQPGEPAATAAPTPSAEPPGAQSAGTDILQLALTIHVEGYNDEARDQSEFDAHLAVLAEFDDIDGSCKDRQARYFRENLESAGGEVDREFVSSFANERRSKPTVCS